LQIRRALAFLVLLAACGASGGPLARIHSAAGTVDVVLVVADTPDARTRGLMSRKHLPRGRGMLFVFDEEEDHEFWMKNTLIPLDMIFIAADGRIVGVAAEATPLSTAAVGVGHPSRFVLEVPGGWAARRGIKAGDRVELVAVRLP